MKINFPAIAIIVLALLCSHGSAAQQYGHRQYDRVQQTHAAGIEFTPLKLFNETGIQHSARVSKYNTYTADPLAIARLYHTGPQAITMSLRTAEGIIYTLEMVQSQPFSDDADMGYIDHSGRHRSAPQRSLHYQGIVKGMEMSLAAMSVFANGEVIMLFSNKEGNFNFGKMKDDSGVYVLYNSRERTEAMPFNCLVKDELPGSISPQRGQSKTTGVVECKKVRVYWEVDSTFLADKGSMTAAQNHLAGLFNIVQGVFYNDGIVLEMSGMYIWTVDDWYSKQNTQWRVGHFWAYWRSQAFSFPGDLAMIMGMSINGNAWGYYDGVCGTAPCAITPLFGGYNNFPAYDWETYATAHETGHNFGSLHTHSCAWNTGPGGSCGSIDNCSLQEAAIGCPTCPTLFDISNINWVGTVMSYCGGRINLSAGFGPIVSAFMRAKTDTAYCLRSVISTSLTAQSICAGDGAITLSYKPNNFGVAPYTYLWSTNAITKDINNISAPGAYHVTITDSNNCIHRDTALVNNYGKPGDGIALSQTMPLCCKDTSFSVTINASLPATLNGCQTVAWLRTTNPVSGFAQLRSAYAGATAADILKSDNDQSVNNSTAAQLSVPSPVNCNSTTGYYYTPFVTRTARPATVYTQASGATTQVKILQKVVGTSTVIPQQGAGNYCDMLNPNLADTVTVVISNYTGRPNYLSIRIVAADRTELHSKHNYPGDGTYDIPVTGTQNHFQPMTVMAYDHHCKNSDSCDLVTLTLQATRKVTYAAIPALSLDSGCVAGTSVYLSFGPDSCKAGNTGDILSPISRVSVYPNPAAGTATLSFSATTPGQGNIRVSNIAGQLVYNRAVSYIAGNNSMVLNVKDWAAGMYFVQWSDDAGNPYNIKLAIR